MKFQVALAEAATRVAAVFETVLAELPPSDVAEAMRYALVGGKGLRGYLVLEGARLHGIDADAAQYVAAAAEALHAYSLVHDDLPCMDDDDLRRGRATVHRKWDDATAVLCGDALQSLAFGLLARPEVGEAAVRVELIAGLSRAAGADGMVLGQALDIAAASAGLPPSYEDIKTLQAHKTGALIEWAGVAGAVMAGADTAPLRRYARALGLAFQIADDILDVEGDAEAAGKRLRKDAGAGKATFVSHLGLDAAKDTAEALVDDAAAALAPYGAEAEGLKATARYVIERDR